MYRTSAIAMAFAAATTLSSAVAAPAAKPTDPQIAHTAYTAGQLDIEAGKQALAKSKNEEGRAFAQRMISDHTSVNDQALPLVKNLNEVAYQKWHIIRPSMMPYRTRSFLMPRTSI
jgi:predicted outer membrane protein